MNTESAVNSVIRNDDKHIVAESNRISHYIGKTLVDSIYEANEIQKVVMDPHHRNLLAVVQ